MKLKIGVVLSNFPVVSETFINTFLSHLGEHEIYIFANISNFNSLEPNWKGRPYFNKYRNLRSVLFNVLLLLKIPIYLRRLITLRKKGVSYKRILLDANIWTAKKLDYLHFPFATEIIGREHYASVLGAKNTISFRGSDVNVYPIFHGMSYTHYWKYIFKVHCNSVELRDKLFSEHGLDAATPVEVIHPALREEYVLDEKALSEMINTRSYEIEHFVTIGRLHWVKDYPLLFQALGELKKQGIRFQYTIIGNGPEKEHLMFLAKEFEIAKNINWIGAANGKEIIGYLQGATLYLQSSLAEGFSNSCLEAQSQGLQCVVTHVSGMKACIQPDAGGCVVSDRNYHSFSDAIKSLVSQSVQSRREQGMNAAMKVTNLFTRERQKEQWLNFFID